MAVQRHKDIPEQAPVCQVDYVNEETVSRLKPQVDRIEGVAAIFKALADDTRLKVIYALSEAELCVCEVATLIGGSKATASYHLRLLNHMGLVKYRKAGKLVYYRLVDRFVGNLVREALRHTNKAMEGEELE